MSGTLKIVILKTADCTDVTLKPALLGNTSIRIVAELTESDDPAVAVRQSRPDVLVVAIGAAPAGNLLNKIADLLKNKRELNVILAGPQRDSDLLLTAMRSGVREFVLLPTQADVFGEITQKIMEVQPARRTGKLLLVHGCSGGCGASTLAGNIAVEIARSGRGRVVLVDLDLYRGQLAPMLDVFPTYTLMDLCRLEPEDLDPARLDSALLTHDSGVRLLARPKDVVGDDIEILHRTVDVIHELMDMFDYVIADMDLRLDVTEGKLVRMADEFILVSQPVLSSVRSAAEVVRQLEALQFDLTRLRLVLNRVPRKLGSVQIESVEKTLKRNVFWEVPEDYACVSESLNLGLPLSEHATSSKVRCSVRDLAMALVRPESAELHLGQQKAGLLKRFFRANVA